MSGFMAFWSREYINNLKKNNDNGPITVIYGSHHQAMPSISSVNVGDVVHFVSLKDGNLYSMARLPIEKIEPAYEYALRTTGLPCGALVPDETIFKSEDFSEKPHKFHQEPIACCAEIAASGENGSIILPKIIPHEAVMKMRFGKNRSSEKPLKLDKKGNISCTSLSGSVRKMSDETFEIFEALF